MGKSLKGKELGKGISQRKDGLYQARFTDRFGKRVTIYGKTYSEINKKLRESQYESSKSVSSSEMTVSDWYEVWFDTYKSHLRDSTQEKYEKTYRLYARNYIGDYKISEINTTVLQNAINQLSTDYIKREAKRLLVDMFGKAVDSRIIDFNYAKSIMVNVSNTDVKEMNIVPQKEIDALIQYTKEHNHYLYPYLAVGFYTGMRVGEMSGLSWEYIDFDNNVITVAQNMYYAKKEFQLHPPKTKYGYRKIPMTKIVREALLAHRLYKEKLDARRPPRRGYEDIILTSVNNNPLAAKGVNNGIIALVRRMQMEGYDVRAFTPHDMRHTFATHCIERGMTPKVLQAILGHASLKTTMDLYTHVTEETKKNEMAIFEMV